jgi:thiosulfate dehydrogenase (quinone) large subunit
MIILKMGVTSVQNWGAATSQISYGLVLFILLAGHSFNIYSIDHWWKNRQTSKEPSSSQQTTNQFRLLFRKFRKKHPIKQRSYLR